MKPCPTSSPTISNSNQNARVVKSSRNSFASSCVSLGKRKKNILQPTHMHVCLRLQLAQSSFRYASPVIQQHQPIANSRRVVQLVNGNKQRASRSALFSQQRHHFSRLA